MEKKSIRLYSNPTEVYRRAKKYLGKTVKIGLSTKKEKNIWLPHRMVMSCILDKWVTKTTLNTKIKHAEKII